MRHSFKPLVVAGLMAAGGGPILAQSPALPTYAVSFDDLQPVPGARALDTKTIDALRGDGIFYFSGSRVVNMRAADKPQGDRYAMSETTTETGVGSFHSNIDVLNFVRDGERRAVGHPTFAVPAPDGSVYLIYQGASPLRVALTMRAYDVAGLPMRAFLRTAENHSRADAVKVGDAKFPAGSVAYLSDVRFIDDVLMLPRRESFTGASTAKQLVANFSKDIPFCLAYEDRQGAKPYALHFRGTGSNKGKTELYAAKTGTMFCARATEQVLAEGTWEERTIGGTRAVVLSFGANVDPLDVGVTNVERESALVAFIEPTRGAPGVRPGKLYRAGARILDHQYRFNNAAATAVRTALGVP